jgi:hypothetical protein
MKDYLRYYHEDRTHLGLGKDTPSGRVASLRIPDRKQSCFLAATRWIASPLRCSGLSQLLAKELDSPIDIVEGDQ